MRKTGSFLVKLVRVSEGAMAFLAFPDCVQAAVRYVTTTGRPIENTFWYRKFSGAVDQSDVDLIAETIDDYVGESFLSLITADKSYVETYVRDMTEEISFQATANASAGVGTATSPSTQNASAMLFVRRSGLVGRSAQGRLYTPFGNVAALTNQGNWSTGSLIATATEIEGLDEAVETVGDYLPIIASRKTMEDTGQVLLSTFLITSWTHASTRVAKVSGRSG